VGGKDGAGERERVSTFEARKRNDRVWGIVRPTSSCIDACVCVCIRESEHKREGEKKRDGENVCWMADVLR